MRSVWAVGIVVLGLMNPANAAEGCTPDEYSVVTSPDGASISILFDDMVADNTAPTRSCAIHIPLTLPEGQSLGVYRVDYRGFAHLAAKGFGELSVDYVFGPNKSRKFTRKIKGPTDDDFTFSENIGAGLMKRAGCGADAALDVAVRISLPTSGSDEDLATLDTTDGASKAGLVYHFDLKPCRP